MDHYFCQHAIIACSFPAIAADDDLPRNIELKPGAAPADTAGQTAADTSSGTTRERTRRRREPHQTPPREHLRRLPRQHPLPPKPKPRLRRHRQHLRRLPPRPPFLAPPPPPPPGLKPEEVVIAVQTALTRVGCDPGAIDGDWGGRSREALAAFGHFAKVDVGKLAPSPEILEVIKGKAEVVCVGPAPAASSTPHRLRSMTMAAAT